MLEPALHWRTSTRVTVLPRPVALKLSVMAWPSTKPLSATVLGVTFACDAVVAVEPT